MARNFDLGQKIRYIRYRRKWSPDLAISVDWLKPSGPPFFRVRLAVRGVPNGTRYFRCHPICASVLKLASLPSRPSAMRFNRSFPCCTWCRSWFTSHEQQFLIMEVPPKVNCGVVRSSGKGIVRRRFQLVELSQKSDSKIVWSAAARSNSAKLFLVSGSMLIIAPMASAVLA